MPEVDGLAQVPITLEHGLLGLLEVITEPVYNAFVASITASSRAHADAHRPPRTAAASPDAVKQARLRGRCGFLTALLGR